jgi:DNA-binding transcriptional ArsR family regulator
MAAVEVFRALGDSVRLEIVERLSKRDELTIKTVTQGLGITRQGARRHLQVLADARLIHLVPRGREVLVQMDSDGLTQAKSFITQIEGQWDRRLEALRSFIEECHEPERP